LNEFQHLYQYAVFAIGDDIQADVSFVSIYLHPKTLNQLNLRVDMTIATFLVANRNINMFLSSGKQP
jgi:hypothetical protein